MAKTYHDLYLDAQRAFHSAGAGNSQLEALEILSYASEKSKQQLYRDMPLPAGNDLEHRMAELTHRHLAGEPVAYIVGEWDFYGLTFHISPHVLIPRPETELLAGLAIDLVQSLPDGTRVLDLGAGSGCVGLAIAQNCKNCTVVLGDMSDTALQVCRQNIRRHGLEERVVCQKLNALGPPDPALGIFDLLVSNPPYVRSGELQELDISVRDYEPLLALDGGGDGLNFYRSIASNWKFVLPTGGKFLLEVGYDQADAVVKLLAFHGCGQMRIHRDASGIQRVVEGTLPF